MSLINDALKRAKAAQDKAPQPESAIPHLKPVESAPGGMSGAGLVLPVVLTFVALGGLFFLWRAAPNNSGAANPEVHARTSASVGTRSTTSPSVAQEEGRGGTRPYQPAASTVMPVVAATNAPAPTASAVPSNAPAAAPVAQVAVSAATTNVPVPAVPVVTKPALPRLQAIVYTPASPSAIISGKTVFVGDRIAGFQVASITRQSATLIGGGSTNLLSLEP